MTLTSSNAQKCMRVAAVLVACLLLMAVATNTVWAQVSAASSYIVRSGDSYQSIASRHGISLSQLHDLNTGINLHGYAPVGQTLRVPVGGIYSPSSRYCPLLHIVNPNETLDWIGGAYGVTPNELARLNGLSAGSAISSGWALCLPAYAQLRHIPSASTTPAAPMATVPVQVGQPRIPSASMLRGHTPVGPWTGYYYNNLGAPVYVTHSSNSHINFNWGTGSPAPGVSADYFSAVWQGNFHFTGQNYRFVAVADDGVRIWVGGTLVIDGWKEQSATLYYRDYAPPAGTHAVRVEFYDASVYAQLLVDWAPH